MSIEPRQLFNFIQGSDITGVSSYDIWKSFNPEGTEAEFLEYLRSGPKGEPGEAAQATASYRIAVSDTVMKKGANNTLLPESITFRGYYRVGMETTRYDYPGRFNIEETTDGVLWTPRYTSNEDEIMKSYIPSSPDVVMIRCTLYAAGGLEDELDTQSVVILTDASAVEVGARNLLAGSDTHIEITKDSTEPVLRTFNVVNGFDLQRFIGKSVILSFYADAVNVDEGKCYIYPLITWSDSTSVNKNLEESLPFHDFSGVSKERINVLYNITAPEGYDTISNVVIITEIAIPENDDIIVFERPKLEIGNIATEWTIAPEDVITLTAVLANDAHTVSTDYKGEDGDYSECITSIQVYNGSNDVTSECAYEINVSAGLTGEFNPTNYIYSVTGMTVDTGYVDITAIYNGISVTKRFSISKSKAGKSAFEAWLEYEENEGKTEEDYMIEHQSDWNQNDEKALNYIKNRTHYIGSNYTEVFSGITRASYFGKFSRYVYGPKQPIESDMLREGATMQLAMAPDQYSDNFTPLFEGVLSYYSFVSEDNIVYEYYVVGNQSHLNGGHSDYKVDFGTHEDTGEAAVVVIGQYIPAGETTAIINRVDVIFDSNKTGSVTVKFKLSAVTDIIVTLDEKFIPDTIARTADVEEKLIEAKEYTDTEISNLIGLAPESRNTIEELSKAIEDHHEVTDLLDSAITKKINLPVDIEGNIINGNAGQILSTNGDGTSTWVEKDQRIEEITVELGTNGTIGGFKTGDKIEAGTNLQTILNKLFQKAIPPTYTSPKLAVTAKSTAAGSYEYGTNVTVQVQATFTQNDGGALSSISILKDGVEVKTGTSSPLSSDSEEIQLLTTVTYKATASYAEGTVKKNNVGEDWPDGHIAAGSVSSSELKFTPYRQGYFYGVLDTDKSTALTSAIIRGCTKKNGAYAAGDLPLIEASSVANRKRIFVACPATNKGVTKVVMPSAMGADCTNDFVKQATTVTVEGANGSAGIAYNVWVYEPAEISDDQTFTVTLG